MSIYDKWNDSDDVDSEVEQEAYDMLYSKEKQNEMNTSEAQSSIICDMNSSTVSMDTSPKDIPDIIVLSDSDCDQPIVVSGQFTNTLYLGNISDNELDDFSYNIDNNFKNEDITLENQHLLQNNLYITDWNIDQDDFSSRKRFSNRYYHESCVSSCGKCLKKGHDTFECLKNGPICIYCGQEGHISKDCSNTVCFICFQNNHSTKKCPFSSDFLKKNCLRCNKRGHITEICPDLWRQYKYTTTPGISPVFKHISSQNRNSVHCANCSKQGHFTDECTRNRMNKRFIGPSPIVEILQFDKFDIYSRADFNYVANIPQSTVEMLPSSVGDSHLHCLDDLNVTLLVGDMKESDLTIKSNQNDTNEQFKIELSNSNNPLENDNDYIMLSGCSNNKNKSTKCSSPKLKGQSSVVVTRSAMNRNTKRKLSNNLMNNLLDDSQIAATSSVNSESKEAGLSKPSTIHFPIIKDPLLKKIFPEETKSYDKIPCKLRKKLKRKLQDFLENGYLPADQNLSQEKMEFWLQEVTTGRPLSYREKKNLLSSVSAALHHISDRVSDGSQVEDDPHAANNNIVIDLTNCCDSPIEKKTRSKTKQNELHKKEERITFPLFSNKLSVLTGDDDADLNYAPKKKKKKKSVKTEVKCLQKGQQQKNKQKSAVKKKDNSRNSSDNKLSVVKKNKKKKKKKRDVPLLIKIERAVKIENTEKTVNIEKTIKVEKMVNVEEIIKTEKIVKLEKM